MKNKTLSSSAKIFIFYIICINIFLCFAVDKNLAQRETVLVKSKSVKDVTYKAPTKGSLALACNMPDAKVYLNNELRGITKSGKLNLQTLEKGSYKLEVRYPMYVAFQKQVNVVAGRSEIINAFLQPNFGFLILPNIKSITGIKVEIDGHPISEPTTNLQLKEAELYIRISPAGEHQVRVLRGAQQIYNKSLTVKAESPQFDLPEPEKAKLLIQSEPVVAAAKVYVDGIYYKDTSEKGSLEISELSPDEQHKIQIDTEKYKPYEITVVPTTDKDTLLKAELEEIVEFFDDFNNLEKWNVPKEWQVSSQVLHVQNSKTLGTIKNNIYRNCDISFDFKLGSTSQASWVIHADEKNYYLFSLDFSKPGPGQLQTYICRDGLFDASKPVKTDIIYNPLEKNKWHRMRVLVEGNKISHILTPNESPDTISIGFFQDSKNLFPFGSIGFTSLNGEDFFIAGGFTICPVVGGCRPEIKARP